MLIIIVAILTLLATVVGVFKDSLKNLVMQTFPRFGLWRLRKEKPHVFNHIPGVAEHGWKVTIGAEIKATYLIYGIMYVDTNDKYKLKFKPRVLKLLNIHNPKFCI